MAMSVDADVRRGAFRLGYRPALDGIRGVAILAVMAFHARLTFAVGGFLGVDAFFVLSGFLITSLLCDEWRRTRSIDLWRFYARRALRLLPALFALLASLYAYSLTLPYRWLAVQIWKEILATLFYVANWALAFQLVPPLGHLGHAWSLAIEEQFYLLWPVLLLVMLRRRLLRSQVLALLVTAIVASASLRALLWRGVESFPRVFFGFDTRADALLVGCMVGLLASYDLLPSSPRARRRVRIAAAGSALLLLCLVAWASWMATYMYRGTFTLASVAVALILIEVLTSPGGPFARGLSFTPLVAVGRISYGLYLWHWPIFLILLPARLDWSVAATAALRFAAAFGVATLSYWCIERPFLRLKTRFNPP